MKSSRFSQFCHHTSVKMFFYPSLASPLQQSVVETWEAGEGIVKSEQEMWPEINSIIDNWGEDPS